MLNKKEINKVLLAAPLCHGFLIHTSGLATEYCAMGALAKAVGATDEELRNSDPGGVTIYGIYRQELRERFGIENYIQFSRLMNANDSDESPITRSKTVAAAVEAMTPQEINEILSTPVSAEF